MVYLIYLEIISVSQSSTLLPQGLYVILMTYSKITVPSTVVYRCSSSLRSCCSESVVSAQMFC